MTKTIKLITNASGDWDRLECDNECVAQGYVIRDTDWIDLLKILGFTVETSCITDEEMEDLRNAM